MGGREDEGRREHIVKCDVKQRRQGSRRRWKADSISKGRYVEDGKGKQVPRMDVGDMGRRWAVEVGRRLTCTWPFRWGGVLSVLVVVLVLGEGESWTGRR